MSLTSPPETPEAHLKLEQELRDTLARYEAILASTLDPVITIDARGTIQVASNSVWRVFGWKPQDLVGRNVNVLMPEPYHSYHDSYLSEYRRTGATNILGRTREFQAVRRDGQRIDVELSVSRVDIPGADEPLFTGIIRDVTRQKAAEHELQRHREHLEDLVAERTHELEESHDQLRLADRLASIGTLAAGLGHDMNNILLPVRCRLDALDAANLPPEASKHFEDVRHSLKYLQKLADGLHMLSLDPEDAEASTEATDIASWWNHVGALLTRGLPKRIDLTIELSEELSPVAIPPHRLTQAVLNLVVNAGEAVATDSDTPGAVPGAVKIWAERAADERFVRLGVTDNGAGMQPEVKRRALDPFFTTKKRGIGTGLGLSLVQGVVRAVGGAIEIESWPHEGTTITLTLPVYNPLARSDGAPLQVAITVADPRVRSLVETLLATAGVGKTNGDVSHSDLWITDEASPAAQHEFLDRPGRRIVTLDAGDGVDPDDFVALRQRIYDAITVVHGARP